MGDLHLLKVGICSICRQVGFCQQMEYKFGDGWTHRTERRVMRMTQNRNKKTGREHGTRVSLLCHFLSNSQLQIIGFSTQKKQFQKAFGPGLNK